MVPRGHGNLLGIGALHGGVVVLDEVLLVLGRVQKCNAIFFVQYLKRNGVRGSQQKCQFNLVSSWAFSSHI